MDGGWQIAMALQLFIGFGFALVAWLRARRMTAGIDRAWLSPWQRLFLRHGWLAAAFPLTEAWVLWMGGFFA